MGTGHSTGVLGLKSVSRQLLGGGLARGISRGVWLCLACSLPEQREPRLPGAMAGAKTGGTTKTAAVSKHNIWSRQGQADQEMSPPAGSATSTSEQLRGRGKRGKPGTDVFRASEELSCCAALNCIEDLLGPSAQLPTGAQNRKDGAGPGARPSQQPGASAGEVSAHDGESLCLSKGSALQAACRDPTTPQCSQAREHHLSPAGSWGQPPGRPGAASPPRGPGGAALHSQQFPGSALPFPGTQPSAGPCSPSPWPLGRVTGAHHAAG